MISSFLFLKRFFLFRLGVILLLNAFVLSSSGVIQLAQADTFINLPVPGTLVSTSPAFNPLQFKGIQVHTQNPLQFDFLIDEGQSSLTGQGVKTEVRRLTKYFLTCLTVPETDLWVNLSPYEKNRIAPQEFGETQMGKDLLEQDYLLKQIVASLSYPEEELGKHFWQRIYKRAYALYGRTDIPINAFNKVWIVPKSADVYVHGNSAFIVHSDLDVMLETDYLALRENLNNTALGLARVRNQDDVQYSRLYSQIMREVILPVLRKEVNEGKNFAVVRQVYNAMILATWYKRHLKDSLFGRMYVGRNKINGVDVSDKNVKEEIFHQYLIAYKKRVYNYIKEDYDPITQQTVPRKYVSGGMDFAMMGVIGNKVYNEVPFVPAPAVLGKNLAMASVDVAMTSNGKPFTFFNSSFKPSLKLNKLRSILPKLALAIGLSVFAFLPTQTAQAATYARTTDGKVAITFTAADQSKGILNDAIQGVSGDIKQMQNVWKKADPQGYARSVFAGNLYQGAGGGAIRRVLGKEAAYNLKNLERFKRGETLTIEAPFPLEAFNTLPQTVSSAVAGATGQVLASPVKATHLTQKIIIKPLGGNFQIEKQTESQSPLLSRQNHGVQPPIAQSVPSYAGHFDFRYIPAPGYNKRSGYSSQAWEQTNQNTPGGSGGGPPDWLKVFIGGFAFIASLGVAGYRRGYTLNGLIFKPHQMPKQFFPGPYAPGSKTPVPAEFLTGGKSTHKIFDPIPTKRLSLEEQAILRVAREQLQNQLMAIKANGSANGKANAAQISDSGRKHLTPEEQEILKRHLEEMRAIVAAGKKKRQFPTLTYGEKLPAHLQNLMWMDVLGSMAAGASVFKFGWLTGGTLIAGGPFAIRLLYLTQMWLHEMIHLVFASALYPSYWKEIWTKRNVNAGLSLKQWENSFMPYKPVNIPTVDLQPFASEGNGWIRNKIIGLSGFLGSALIAYSALALTGLTPFTLLLIPGCLGVLLGSLFSGDVVSTENSRKGVFGCGFFVLVKRVGNNGIPKKSLKPVLDWAKSMMQALLVRGGQSAGIITEVFDQEGFMSVWVKKLKQKRAISLSWKNGLVLYRDLLDEIYDRFYNALPKSLVPVKIIGGGSVIKILGHNRFATAGKMVVEAAQPQWSPKEKRNTWMAVTGQLTKIADYIKVTIGFNGDHDATRIGVPFRYHLFDQTLGFGDMRSFFAASVHQYYQGRVTLGYLKEKVSNGKEYKQQEPTNYGAVLRALRKKGYISLLGYVDHRFTGLDEDFKNWFPGYKPEVFAEIECALFGLSPGDAPIIAMQQLLYETQGSWAASIRYAHVMVNHHSLKEAMSDILFKEDEKAVGDFFDKIFAEVQPHLCAIGSFSEGPDGITPLSKYWVRDRKTADEFGMKEQYDMIEAFKDILELRINEEIQENTAAGKVFKAWEQKWHLQGIDEEHMLRMTLNVAVEKFFTGDGVQATMEFAEHSEGQYGSFRSTPLDNGVTFYQNNQDVIIGLNRNAGIYASASDPRTLKSEGPNGEKLDEVMHLKDGEIVNLSFSPTGEIIVKSWMRVKGQWKESTPEELKARFYNTAKYVNGVKNPYYAPPPKQYKDPKRMVQQDLEELPEILNKAKAEWDDPDSFNSQSVDYLAGRISKTIKEKGKARLVVVGYDNSRKLAELVRVLGEDLISKGKLEIIVKDSNEFLLSRSIKSEVLPDDIFLFVSKSGATSSTKLALRVVQTLIDRPENIFCMSGRIDSVLFTMIGQGLRPEDKFTKRIFVTGDFYPAETPVVSEVLLMFQLQQLALNLARKLGYRNDSSNSLGLKFSDDKLEKFSGKIKEASVKMAQELTGYDLHANPYADADPEVKATGAYLGKIALEPWRINRFMDLFVFGVLTTPILLVGHFLGLGWFASFLNVVWINYVVRFLAREGLRKITGRPAYGEDAGFKLFIAAPKLIAETQRDFLSRLLTNRFTSMGPAAIYAGDPTIDHVSSNSSDMGRGDIDLRFYLDNKPKEGEMGVKQATYARTAIFRDTLRGGPQLINVPIHVPLEENATKEEINLMNDTVGVLGMMIAAKKIGVEMAKIMSHDGKWFNLAFSFSGAAVHTTPINPPSEEVMRILYPAVNDEISTSSEAIGGQEGPVDHAMNTVSNIHEPGGIDMNSRLMDLNLTESRGSHFVVHDQALKSAGIESVTPGVVEIVPITTDMLKAMLGESYLN